jgi:hypothetical protein
VRLGPAFLSQKYNYFGSTQLNLATRPEGCAGAINLSHPHILDLSGPERCFVSGPSFFAGGHFGRLESTAVLKVFDSWYFLNRRMKVSG